MVEHDWFGGVITLSTIINRELSINKIINTIVNIKEKIEKFYTKLNKNEALTRYTLVDPLLLVLGWDLSDPMEVIPEFPTDVGIPDYAIFREGKPLIFIEVKALGKLKGNTIDKTISQAALYAIKEGVQYLVVTDGDIWLVYDLYRRGSMDEKLIVSWSILKDEPVAVAFKSLVIANIKPLILQLYGKNNELDQVIEVITSKITVKSHRKTLIKKQFRGPIDEEIAREIILTILKSENKPLKVSEILEKAEAIFKPTDKDIEILSRGEERWKVRLRWEIWKLSKEGVIKKVSKGMYTI